MAAEIVKNNMRQLKGILDEMETVNERLKRLKEKKKDIEGKIISYLKQVEQPAVKYDDIIVFAKEKNKKQRLKKTECQKSINDALLELGINDPQLVLKTIKEASQGELTKETAIQIKKI